MDHPSGFGMDPNTVLLVIATQAFVVLCNLVAFFLVRRYISRMDPIRRWRHLALLSWLSLGLFIAVLQVVVIIIGCPPFPVMRLLLWLDRTNLVAGYIAMALTAWQLRKFTTKVN